MINNVEDKGDRLLNKCVQQSIKRPPYATILMTEYT